MPLLTVNSAFITGLNGVNYTISIPLYKNCYNLLQKVPDMYRFSYSVIK